MTAGGPGPSLRWGGSSKPEGAARLPTPRACRSLPVSGLSGMSSTCEPTEHQVPSRFGYSRHAIYISDDRGRQFGGYISDKPHAAIEAVPLKQSDPGATARVVQHGRAGPAGGYLPPADRHRPGWSSSFGSYPDLRPVCRLKLCRV